MIVSSSKWFRGLLLASIYVLGVLGILGSSGAGIGDDGCFSFDAPCEPLIIPPLIFPEFEEGGAAEGFNDTVNSIATALDSSDDVYVGGVFTIYKNAEANRIARLNNDGSLDTGFITNIGFNDEVRFIAPATDGSGDVYVGGSFTNYNGTAVGGIVRLNLDGTLDTNFVTGTGFNGEVKIIAPAIVGIGDVYVGGSFTSYNGTTVGNGVIRLNDDGSLDAGFSTGSGWGEASIAPAADGSGDVYVARSSSPGISRLNSDGTIDPGFDTDPTGFNDAVRVIAVANDGSGDVYASGSFSDYNGTGNIGITRLNSDGSLDTGFIATAGFDNEGEFITLAIDGSGDVYVTRTLGSFLGPRSGVARLNNDGSIDTGFDTGPATVGNPLFNGSNGFPKSVAPAIDGSGDFYVVGDFTRYNLTPAARIARLTAEGVTVR
jgi:uncharacterized delta-60 repeat protein